MGFAAYHVNCLPKKAIKAYQNSSHLLLFDHPLADHLTDDGLHEAGSDPFPIAIAIAIVGDELLDEPFGALDALTRPKLQQDVLEIWRHYPQAVMMITHDVDEAIFTSDRVVMMTNGPKAKIGKILDISLPRPRDRHELRESSEYYELQNQALEFLERYQ